MHGWYKGWYAYGWYKGWYKGWYAYGWYKETKP